MPAPAARASADSPPVADLWGSASEVAADTFAFAHAGYASVAALHDVTPANRPRCSPLRPLDPHPIAYLRVLLNTEMGRRFHGVGRGRPRRGVDAGLSVADALTADGRPDIRPHISGVAGRRRPSVSPAVAVVSAAPATT